MWWLIGLAVVGSIVSDSGKKYASVAEYNKAITINVSCEGEDCPIPYSRNPYKLQSFAGSTYEEDDYKSYLPDNPYTVYIPQRNAYYFYDRKKKLFIVGLRDCNIYNAWGFIFSQDNNCQNNQTVVYNPKTNKFSSTNNYQAPSNNTNNAWNY